MKASEVFAKAADELIKRGHAKYSLCDSRGRVCVAGALNLVVHGRPDWDVYGTDATPFVDGLLSYVVGRDPIVWNNEDERTQAEVVAALDAAHIIALQEEGVEPEDVL